VDFEGNQSMHMLHPPPPSLSLSQYLLMQV
jgi:hypothetical protein